MTLWLMRFETDRIEAFGEKLTNQAKDIQCISGVFGTYHPVDGFRQYRHAEFENIMICGI